MSFIRVFFFESYAVSPKGALGYEFSPKVWVCAWNNTPHHPPLSRPIQASLSMSFID